MPSVNAQQVFLCHSSTDKSRVRSLYDRLRADGFRPWLDSENLLPGQEWEHEIRRAISSSDVVVVCLSTNSVHKTGFVQKEIRVALDAADKRPEGAIYVIPVRLEPCEIPDRLKHLHSVDLFDEAGYGKLCAAVQKAPSTSTPGAAPGLPLEKVYREAAATLARDEPSVNRPTLDVADPRVRRASRPPPTTGARRVVVAVRRRWKIVLAATVTAAIAAVTVVAVVVTTHGNRIAAHVPACEDIGKSMAGLDDFRWNRQTWIDAYNSAGGRAVLGCPVPIYEQGLVHQWGQGLSQDLADGNHHQSRLMAIDPDHVIVMTGTYWTDYTEPNERYAAGKQGYPTSDPIPCGDANVVELIKGDFTPGAMVTSPQGHFIWLPRAAWRRYQQLGGVKGALGRPLNSLGPEMTGVLQFEHGRIVLAGEDANATLDNPDAAYAPTTSMC